MKKTKLFISIISICCAVAIILSALPMFTALATAIGSSKLINGDFETGDFTGYDVINTTGNGATVKEHNGSFAAFLPGNKDGNGAKERFVNQRISLKAGDYVFKFDADIASSNVASDKTALIFGIYTALSSYNRGYASGNQIVERDDVTITNRDTGSAVSIEKTANGALTDDFKINPQVTNDDHSYKVSVTMKFELAEDKDIFISLGVNTSYASAYIDNLSLKPIDHTVLLENGDFETGDFTGYTIINTSGKGVSVKNYNGSFAAFLPGNNGENGAKERFVNQKVSLVAGEYVLKFDADISSNNVESSKSGLVFGLYTALSSYNRGYASGNQIAERDDVTITNRDTGAAVAVRKTASGALTDDFKIIPTAVNDDYSFKVRVSIKFILTENKDVYLSLGTPNTDASAYVDNIKLLKEDKTNLLTNGNFSEYDFSGYIVNNTSGKGVSVQEYGGSYAAFLPGNNGENEAKERFVNQKVSLPAGCYIFSFDADIASNNVASSKAGLVFGVYTALSSYNRGYASGNQIAERDDVTIIKRDDGSTVSVRKTASGALSDDFKIIPTEVNDDYSFKVTVSIKFKITEDKDIYVSLGAPNTDASAYIDNLKLIVDASGSLEDTTAPNYNGDFEKGNNSGYKLSNNTKVEIVSAVKTADEGKAFISGNYAAYLPGRHEGDTIGVSNLIKQITLDAGKYVVSFNADIISDDTNGSVDFGVHTGEWNTEWFRGSDKSSNIVHTVRVIDRNTSKEDISFTEQLDNDNKSQCFRIDGIVNQAINSKVYAYFEITDEMVATDNNEVYFCVSFPKSNKSTRVYLDDVHFELGEPPVDPDAGKIIKNGDFEKGNLNGYIIGNTTAVIDPVKVVVDPENPDNYVAYLPGRTDNNDNYTRFINQKISLTKGWYEWSFDANLEYTDNYGLVFGVYEKISSYNRGYGQADNNQLASQADSVVTNTATNAISMPNVISSYNDLIWQQHGKFSFKVRFYIAENQKDVYVSIGIPNSGAKAYIDNMAVNSLTDYTPVDLSDVRNGDFELGNLEGYIYTYDQTKEDAIKVVDYNGSKVAYIPKRNDELGGAQGRFLNQELKLGAGRYILEYDLDIKVETPGTYSYYHGIYTQLDQQYVRGRGTNSQIADAVTITNRVDGKPLYITAKNQANEYYLSLNKYKTGDIIRAHVVFEFELLEQDSVYFSAGINTERECAWLDNIKLGINTKEKIVPQTYDDPKIVYFIDFEGDKSQPLDQNYQPNPYYTRTTEQAHSGKYSVRWNPKDADGYKYLCYSDNNGYNVMEPTLKPNTSYRFSFWYNQPKGDQNTKYAYQSIGQSLKSARVRKAGWQYFSYDFVTGDNPEDEARKTVWICAAYTGNASYLYFDDIKLEELVPSVLSIEESGTYCEEYHNEIPNGRFEKELKGTIWDNESISIERIKAAENDNAQSGDYYAHLSGSTIYKTKIKLWKNYTYRFAFSYRMNEKTNLKIGILDNKGNVMQPISGAEFKETSLITPTSADGEWNRFCYSFLSPVDGYVYFYIEGSSLDIDLDEICLFRKTQAYDEDPNMLGKNTDEWEDEEISDNLGVFDDVFNDDEISDDIDNNVNDNQNTSTDNNSNDEAKPKINSVIVIVCSLAGIIIAAAVVFIILKKRSIKKVK